MNKQIVINLCGPLQSYGVKDYFEIRGTRPNPTKYAIAGILACCAGIPRKDERIREIENSIKITEIKMYKNESFYSEWFKNDFDLDNVEATVINPNIFEDYQIAKGTEENPIWDADGKQMDKNLVIKKSYISDALFRVTIEDTAAHIDEYVNWLNNPIWTPYLGRKCCIPSIPIYSEKYSV